ncbi:tetratricopeptide repeat protein [Vibrio parahaemolyticus]|nr:tetratricopeptide repeat protein [Vibrio parahaemolyticus]EGQ7883563.1 tetratricopeptide repeat protein [Vibrio parahaemolyticus]EGQ9369383.1 tetratricopeptide repeat protein [Vibrio parahaemolyticus]EGQ9421553.1 tetratricopeptide repeat protein [Vibrio parahaemolyticus]EGQ9424951.1 tetratricopeptide repeat protein [Vibrio parahaemolyticus]
MSLSTEAPLLKTPCLASRKRRPNKVKMLSKSLLAVTLGAVINHSVMAQTPTEQTQAQPTAAEQVQQPTPQQVISKLAYQAQDKKLPTEQRVQALRELGNYPNQNALVAVARGLQDKDAAIREAAIVGAQPYAIENRWRMVEPLLKDESSSVRIAAALNLVRDYSVLTEAQRPAIEKPVDELLASLKSGTDNNTQLLLADVYRWHENWKQADDIYQALLSKMPENPDVWLNLADNYRAQQREQEAIDTLDKAIERLPDNAALHYSKSLTLVRLNDKEQAANEIEKAANMAKNNSYFWYLNGVLQEEFSVDKAVKSFEQAYLISGAPEQLYAVCDIYIRYDNPKTDECLAELEKVAPSYVIDQLKQKRALTSAKPKS